MTSPDLTASKCGTKPWWERLGGKHIHLILQTLFSLLVLTYRIILVVMSIFGQHNTGLAERHAGFILLKTCQGLDRIFFPVLQKDYHIFSICSVLCIFNNRTKHFRPFLWFCSPFHIFELLSTIVDFFNVFFIKGLHAHKSNVDITVFRMNVCDQNKTACNNPSFVYDIELQWQ